MKYIHTKYSVSTGERRLVHFAGEAEKPKQETTPAVEAEKKAEALPKLDQASVVKETQLRVKQAEEDAKKLQVRAGKPKEEKAVASNVPVDKAADAKVNAGGEAKQEDQETPEEEKKPTTNKERIDQGIAKAKAVLNDKNAKPMDKISAVISLVMLSFENISRQIDGTLNLKPADKNGEVPENVADDKTVIENKSVQRKRLQQELKKSDKPVDAFIKDKQDSLDKKVDETNGETVALNDQIKEFDTQLGETKDKQSKLQQQIDQSNQSLTALDAKGADTPESKTERAKLKTQIDDAVQAKANLDDDIQAITNKKQRSVARRDALMKGMSEGDKAAIKKDVAELKLMKADAEKAMDEYKTDMEVTAKELGKKFPSFKEWMTQISVVFNEKTITPEIKMTQEAAKAIEEFGQKNDLKVQMVSKLDDNGVVDIKDLKLVLDQFLKKAS